MIIPTHLKRLTLPVLLSVALYGCGGSSSFTPESGSTTTTTTTTGTDTDDTTTAAQSEVTSLEISASSAVLLSQGSNEVTISAVAKDKNNNILPEEAVTFSVDNYATIIADEGNATASINKATLTSGMNHPEARTVVVTVTAGELSKTLSVVIDDTPMVASGGDTGVVALDVQASASNLYSLGSNNVVISVVAKNKTNNVVSDVPVAFSVDNNAQISPASGNDTAEVKTATLTSGLGHPEARKLTVTITSGSLTQTVVVDVVEAIDPVDVVDDNISDLEISASSRQLYSDGVNPVVISAIAKDANNNIVPDAEITFKVNNFATVEADAGNSGASVKTANIMPGLNHPENRALEVEVIAGGIVKSLNLEVVGTSVLLEGPESIAINNPTTYTIKLQDSGKKPLALHPITVESSAGSLITPINGFNSTVSGEMTFNLTALADGEDVITVTSLGAMTSKSISVSGNDFTLESDIEEINILTPEEVTLLWTKDGNPQANQLINLSATRGVLSNNGTTINNIRTDENGEATFTIESESAGTTVITATTGEGLSATLPREFVATTPHYISTQASPTVVAPYGISSIIAKVRDVKDNPVKNQKIIFGLEDKVNGELSNSEAVTDSLGRASVTYTASESAGSKDGIVISTYVQGFRLIKDEIKLTVGGQASRIVLGHDENLIEDDIYYVKKYGVIVTDSSGNPVKDQEVAFTLTPTHYYKGTMEFQADENPDATFVGSAVIVDNNSGVWERIATAVCPSEDLDNDGNLDNGEDQNGNNTLEPSHDAAVVKSEGKTDSDGKIVVTIVYPQSRAQWSRQQLSVSALVEGTEVIEHAVFDLPIAAGDVKDKDIDPPNRLSPYGQVGSCSSRF